MKESKKLPIIKDFLINGKNSRIVVNCNCILCEPDDLQNYRTIIPLNLVLSVRSCFCQKVKQHICDCVTKTEFSSNLNDSSSLFGHPYTSFSTKLIRIFYAVQGGRYSWKLNTLCLYPIDSNDIQLNEWIDTVNQLLKEFKRPKKLLVFINPFGGRKKGPKIFDKKILPIFKAANCTIESILTQKANHARDVILDQNFPLYKYDGVICVGGDGMFAELLNGAIIRTQIQSEVNYNSVKSPLKQPNIVVGVIPTGSTDAVAFSIYGVNDPVTAVLHIVLGNKLNIDVTAVHSTKEKKLLRYVTSFIGYGFFGDVIADSEKNRWLGARRYYWSSFKQLLTHRVYCGDLKIQVSTLDGSPRDSDICTSDCALCAKSSIRSKFEHLITPLKPEGNKMYETNQNKEKEQQQQPHQQEDKRLEESNDNEEKEEVEKDEKDTLFSHSIPMTITGKFVAINAAIIPCRCEKSKKGMSPSAHIGNGCADLILVSKCSRMDYIRFMLRVGFLEKSPFDLNFVKVYRVKEFEFSPIIKFENSSKSYQISGTSVWNCDGELVIEPAVHVKIHCQLLPVFGIGLENRNGNVK